MLTEYYIWMAAVQQKSVQEKTLPGWRNNLWVKAKRWKKENSFEKNEKNGIHSASKQKKQKHVFPNQSSANSKVRVFNELEKITDSIYIWIYFSLIFVRFETLCQSNWCYSFSFGTVNATNHIGVGVGVCVRVTFFRCWKNGKWIFFTCWLCSVSFFSHRPTDFISIHSLCQIHILLFAEFSQQKFSQ